MRLMGTPRAKGKPTFFWQSLLILLPAALLAAIGFYSLRKDRLLVEGEARSRAQQFADSLAGAVWADWNRVEQAGPAAVNWEPFHSWLRKGYYFQVDAIGRLIHPPPNPGTPVPDPLDLGDLDQNQRDLWAGVSGALYDRGSAAQGIRQAVQLLQTRLPPRVAANATFALGSLQLKAGDSEAAAKNLKDVCDRFPSETRESGLPLLHLAEALLMDSAGSAAREDLGRFLPPADAIRSNAVYQPSILSPHLLKLSLQLEPQHGASGAAAAEWQQLWAGTESARRAYLAARNHLGRSEDPFRPDQTGAAARANGPTADGPALGVDSAFPRAMVVDSDQPYWLLLAGPTAGPSITYFALPREEAQSLFRERLKGLERSLPAYFGITCQLGGRTVSDDRHPRGSPVSSPERPDAKASGANRAGSPPLLLAESARTMDGASALAVSVFLTDGAALLSQHSQRTVWFGLLIAGAAASTCVGLWAARNAFRRQQRLVEMKSNFVSSVSHELRAPVASMRLMAEGLERGRIVGATKQSEYFRLIVQECRRLTSLIENVLDFSRIDQGRKSYEFEPTDAVALVEQTVRLMEPCAGERQVTLTVVLDRPQLSTLNPQPELDALAIQQALVNLLDNAIKHSPPGQSVTVGLLAVLGPHPFSLNLFVEDHGDGIPTAEHERIFEPFYRLGSELRRETQGIGIGLTIVKHIVEGHGGRVLVRSAVGQGSRFTIELPLGGQTPLRDDGAAAKGRAPCGRASPLRTGEAPAGGRGS